MLKLTGRDEDPATVILGEGERRLHVSAAGEDLRGDLGRQTSSRFACDVSAAASRAWCSCPTSPGPKAVLLDGRRSPQRDEIENGPQPGWRYDEANAYPGDPRRRRRASRRSRFEGAEFRSVRRLPWPAEEIAFEFDESTEGWIAGAPRRLAGRRRRRACGQDHRARPLPGPQLVRVAGDDCPVIRLRMRVTAGQGGQFFWTTESSPGFAEDKTVRFAVQPDGQFHEYRLEPGRDPAWAGQTITALRIDPGNAAPPGEFSVDYVRGSAN